MRYERFMDYIDRFNARDPTAFDDYLQPDAEVLNGRLEIHGVQEMRQHYERIWQGFSEDLHIERFVSDETTLAIRMWTHFTAHRTDPDSLFGPVQEGEAFDFRGLIMYHIGADGRFEQIQVAYNSFSHTYLDGRAEELGIPH